jgi:hypothetical protein
MSSPLQKLKRVLETGLAATAELWPPIRQGYDWVHRAAAILGSEDQDSPTIRRRLASLLAAMVQHSQSEGTLLATVAQFRKVSRSYWRGLFACYTVPGLPRTNNALEQTFGSHRYHERRATGRKAASPALVLRGAARMIAAVATRQRPFTRDDLAFTDWQRWRDLRRTLEQRRQQRVERFRFRRDPEQYLRRLETQFTQLSLPS